MIFSIKSSHLRNYSNNLLNEYTTGSDLEVAFDEILL